MNIVTFILMLIFVIAVCSLIGMKTCNELDCIFTLLPHSQYKNIADKILKTQITFVIIGMCIGCALMYALITNNVIVI